MVVQEESQLREGSTCGGGALKKFFEGETVSKAVKFLDLVETSRKLETN